MTKHIPQWYFSKRTTIISTELHGFYDASERAYAAGVYLRMTDTDSNMQVTLVTSKTKVAPVKKLTIPCLWLCGAHLLAQLLYHIREVFELPIAQVFAWTDSTIVLSWLVGNPRQFKTYIASSVWDHWAYWTWLLEPREWSWEPCRLHIKGNLSFGTPWAPTLVELSRVVETGTYRMALTIRAKWDFRGGETNLSSHCHTRSDNNHFSWPIFMLYLIKMCHRLDVLISQQLLLPQWEELKSTPDHCRNTGSQGLLGLWSKEIISQRKSKLLRTTELYMILVPYCLFTLSSTLLVYSALVGDETRKHKRLSLSFVLSNMYSGNSPWASFTLWRHLGGCC